MTTTCGCSFTVHGMIAGSYKEDYQIDYDIEYCPMHAAAPDMLAALEMVRDTDYDPVKAYAAVTAAIAKAKVEA